jgi:alpha-ketoglutarate-dependent taurine dioxygenase
MLSVSAVTPVIGAEVGGIDLNDPLEETYTALQEALVEHQVLCFRAQENLTAGTPSILRAVEIPTVGRDAMWTNMDAVFADLSSRCRIFWAAWSPMCDTLHRVKVCVDKPF